MNAIVLRYRANLPQSVKTRPWHIRAISPTGGGKFNVTDNNTDDGTGLSYSPSGQKIAYSGRDGLNGDNEIYTIKPGGGGKFKVTDNTTSDRDPSWGSS